MAATVECPSSTAPRLGAPLPPTTIAVTMAACRIANPQNTSVLASRYAVVDSPTACSRWKMARSPTRSRIVSATPMNAAAGSSKARICAASSGVPGMRAGLAEPGITRHGQRQRAQNERQQGQEHEVRAVRDDEPHLSARDRRNWRGTLVCTGSPRSAGLSDFDAGCGSWRSRNRRLASSGSAPTWLKILAQLVVPITSPMPSGGPQ